MEKQGKMGITIAYLTFETRVQKRSLLCAVVLRIPFHLQFQPAFLSTECFLPKTAYKVITLFTLFSLASSLSLLLLGLLFHSLSNRIHRLREFLKLTDCRKWQTEEAQLLCTFSWWLYVQSPLASPLLPREEEAL